MTSRWQAVQVAPPVNRTPTSVLLAGDGYVDHAPGQPDTDGEAGGGGPCARPQGGRQQGGGQGGREGDRAAQGGGGTAGVTVRRGRGGHRHAPSLDSIAASWSRR